MAALPELKAGQFVQTLTDPAEISSVLPLAQISVLLLVATWSYDSILAIRVFKDLSAVLRNQTIGSDDAIRFYVLPVHVKDGRAQHPPGETSLFSKTDLTDWGDLDVQHNVTEGVPYYPALRLYWDRGENSASYHGQFTRGGLVRFIVETVPDAALSDLAQRETCGFPRLSPDDFNTLAADLGACAAPKSRLMILFVDFSKELPAQLAAKIGVVKLLSDYSAWKFGSIDLSRYSEYALRFGVGEAPALLLLHSGGVDDVIEVVDRRALVLEPLASLLRRVRRFQAGLSAPRPRRRPSTGPASAPDGCESSVHAPLRSVSQESLEAGTFHVHTAWVIFHAPWCAFCQRAMQAYREVARQLQGKDVELFEYDASRLGIPASVDTLIDGFPTVLRYPKVNSESHGETPQEYRGPHDVPSLVSVIKSSI